MSLQIMRPLELYIHIPFCIRKCNYCDFLSAPAKEAERQEYIEGLCRQIRSYRELAKAYHVVSIFLGGGTPSILEGEQILAVFQAIHDTFSVEEDAEVTIEANPGTVTREKLKSYRQAGINRISIGLQSACNEELKILGRFHTYEEFLKTYSLAREEGYQNLNVDLMSAIPRQTVRSWSETLQKIARLGPEHISAYSLMIEEGTPFYERYGNGEHGSELPGEEEERQMYHLTKSILGEYGYHRYEISNYAKPGYECRHNLGYWNRTEYLGIGVGAASLIDNQRWKQSAVWKGLDADGRMAGNEHPDMRDQIEEEHEEFEIQGQAEEYKELSMHGQIEEYEKIDVQGQMEEYMFLGLRKMEGVSRKQFRDNFGYSMEEVYGDVLQKMYGDALMEQENDFVRLTERGIDISNYVMSEFLH